MDGVLLAVEDGVDSPGELGVCNGVVAKLEAEVAEGGTALGVELAVALDGGELAKLELATGLGFRPAVRALGVAIVDVFVLNFGVSEQHSESLSSAEAGEVVDFPGRCLHGYIFNK